MGNVIFLFYNLLFPVFGLFYLASFFISSRRSLLKDFPSELAERFGMPSSGALNRISGEKPVWLHAASVGEVNSVAKIIDGIRTLYPGRPIVITTSTSAGKRQALKLQKADAVFLAPLDFYPFVLGFLRAVSPAQLILVETELWPNTLILARRLGVKTAVINGRISRRSLSAYRLAAPLFRKALSGVETVCAQTETDASRFAAMGVAPGAVSVTGNIKYDLLDEPCSARPKFREVGQDLDSIGWGKKKILTAGSTHPGEEEMVVETFLELKKRHSDVRLALAPRHLERLKRTAQMLEARGVKFFLWSRRPGPGPKARQPQDFSGACCVLVDEMGWLNSFYAHSCAAYVGGTFVKKGGHNILEPAACGIPVLFSLHTENTREAADMLVSIGGGFRVASSKELASKLELFIEDPTFGRQTGECAFQALANMRGATSRTLRKLEN